MHAHYKRLRGRIFVPSLESHLYLGHVVFLLVLMAYPILMAEFDVPLFVFTILTAFYVLYSMILPEKLNIPMVVVGTIVIIMLYFLDDQYDPGSSHYLIKSSLYLLFAVLMFASMLREIVYSEISLRFLYQSIDCYLVLGLAFAFAFRTLHFTDARSFNFPIETDFNHLYLSFIVLSSVGLGDLVPTTLAAKAIVVLNGLFGQIYLAFFAALIVGKFLAKSMK